MEVGELLEAARQCRTQSRAFQGNERKLLVRIADMFEVLAAGTETRNSVASTRCW
jgi:hypothetical protein